ncbi:MAG TPA: FlgD immunoglobulin-like domain containing protein [Candidatus Cloacimonadota bacterium]|nr:FlgD immunoglobulin-like domain containing protein [Candidatus Cloacimonadota bacterium]
MKRTFLFLIFFLFITLFYAVTDVDISQRIKIDSLMVSYFTDDEVIMKTPGGTLLEYPDDSFWGVNNDVRQLKVSWDSQFFYVEVDASCWGNNVILLFDIYDDYGFTNMRDINTWKRAFQFYGLNPDFFLATWDTNVTPQFWKVREGSTNTCDQMSVSSISSYNTGNLNRFMVAQIPWSIFYYNTQRNMASYPKIKMVAVITGGADNTGGPDVMPDNLGGMNNDSSVTEYIDNYVTFTIDANADGNADMGIRPQDNRTFFKQPPFQSVALKINTINFYEGRKLNVGRDQVLHFKITPNRASKLNIEIYNMKGELVGYCANNTTGSETGTEQTWSWDGRDKKGKKVPFGFYILRAITDNGEVSKKETIVVYQ